MFVDARFHLSQPAIDRVRAVPPSFGFDGFGELIYRRTYSRIKDDGSSEDWHDTVLRVMNGVMSIRKDWYLKNSIRWDERRWQDYATGMAIQMAEMKWLPPGRGLFMMGTNYVYERGSAPLSNCGRTSIRPETLAKDLAWIMDGLMLGIGVSTDAFPGPSIPLYRPQGPSWCYTVPDSREGWVTSLELLVQSYINGARPVEFDYSLVRPAGAPLRGIGGYASGPEPLQRLHSGVRERLESYMAGQISRTRLIADVVNLIGCIVVVGGVRRSSELLHGLPGDKEFVNLKNYSLYPERAEIGYVSNNSPVLRTEDDYSIVDEDFVDRVLENGEPGLINLMNAQRHGRMGEECPDSADGTNPCGEALLEGGTGDGGELCCLSESVPMRCSSEEEFYQACGYAAFFASTVQLLPTHWKGTNEIIARNRRIGVSVMGVAELIDTKGWLATARILRTGYDAVVWEAQQSALEAQVPSPIRHTAEKPSGTVGLVAGQPPGAHHPLFRRALRRVRVNAHTPFAEFLRDQGLPWEWSLSEPDTMVFEYPVSGGPSRPSTEVSVREQFETLELIQRCWADQSVSITLMAKKETERQEVEQILRDGIRRVKTLTVLPHTTEGVYPQSPYTGLTEEEYLERRAKLPIIDWSKLKNYGASSDGDKSADAFCSSGACELRARPAAAEVSSSAG